MATIIRGKQIKISGGNLKKTIVGLLEEDITLNLSSTFEPFISQVPGGKILNQLSKSLKFGVSTQMTQFGFLTWTKTEPLSFSAGLGFYATGNAYRQVYEPAIALAKTPLPSIAKGLAGKLGNLKAPGPAITEVFDDTSGKRVATGKKRHEKGGSFAITIGKILYLSKVIIVKAEPTFSSDVAWGVDPVTKKGSYYPIWAKVLLDIKTITSAYTSLLDNRPK